MAIRITKVGVIPEQRLWVAKCNRCKTEFEYSQADASNTGHDQRDGDWSTIGCPLTNCGAQVYGTLRVSGNG